MATRRHPRDGAWYKCINILLFYSVAVVLLAPCRDQIELPARDVQSGPETQESFHEGPAERRFGAPSVANIWTLFA